MIKLPLNVVYACLNVMVQCAQYSSISASVYIYLPAPEYKPTYMYNETVIMYPFTSSFTSP